MHWVIMSNVFLAEGCSKVRLVKLATPLRHIPLLGHWVFALESYCILSAVFFPVLPHSSPGLL